MARLLIIEDHPTNLELMTYLLRAFGHTTMEASDGTLGVALARSAAPDLVLCDVQLPGMDGYEVLRALKGDAAVRAIPVVAVTALAMVGDREKILAAGFDGYIPKPIEPGTFVAQVEALLRPEQRSTAPPHATTAAAEAHVPPPATRHGTILVVDDVRANIDFVRSLLEPFGYTVVAAASVSEALAITQNVRPDLIVSDVHMPQQSGYALIEAVRAADALRSIPFMFLASTPRTPREREHALALGAVKFILRPIEPQALLAEIEDALGARRKDA